MSKLWNSIKNKVDESATSMQEGDWAAMESLLNESPATAPNRSRRWGLFTVLVFGVMALSALLVQPWSHTEPSTEVTSSETVIPIEESNLSDEPDSKELSSQESSVAVVSSSSTSGTSGEHTEASAPSSSARTEAQPSNNALSSTPTVGAPSQLSSASTPTSNNVRKVQPDAGALATQSANADVPETTMENQVPGSESEAFANETPRIELAQKSWVSRSDHPLGTDQIERTVTLEEEVESSETLEDAASEASESPSSILINSSTATSTGMFAEGHYAISPSLNSSLLSNELGLEIGYDWKGWTFQTGAHYVNTSGFISTDYKENVLEYDTTTSTSFEFGVDTSVVKYWVITGYYTGEYRYDTTYTSYTDTIITTDIDSTLSQVSRTKRTHITTSYVQIPLVAGYEWRSGSWGVKLQGGVNFRSTTYVSDEFQSTTAWGVDAILRPAISYHWTDDWSVFLRTSFRLPVTSDPLLNRNRFTRMSFGVGVRYRF